MIALARHRPQTDPPPGVGPSELADVLPVLRNFGWFVVGFVAVLLVGWYVVEPAVSRGVRRRNRNNPTLQEAITRYVRLLAIVAAIVVGAATAGYGHLLADSALVIAAGTLAVGVAAQTVIGSLVSGLVLVSDPQFNVGNYIEWPGGEGEVASITLRVTRVHTPDGELLTIPNTTLTSEPVTRPYGRGRYRVVERVDFDYDDDVDAALDHLRAAAAGLDAVLADPAPQAYVDELGDGAVVARVHYWVEGPRPRDVVAARSAYARAAKERLDGAGITISPASKRDLEGHVEVDHSESTSA